MIRRLVVEGYKSLAHVELDGLKRLVLLYGPNASGKSNLLDALDLLGHLVREDTLASAFLKHRGNRLGRPVPVRWFFSGAPDAPDAPRRMSFEVDLDLHPPIRDSVNEELKARERSERLERPYTRLTRSRLRYEIQIEYRPDERALEVVREALTPLTQSGEHRVSEVPFIKHELGDNRASVKLERQAHPRYFTLPRQRSLLSEVGDLVNHPHLVAAARELASIRVYYVEPTRMRAEVSDIRAEDPGPHGEALASFYYWLSRAHETRYKNLVHDLARLIPGLQTIDVKEGSEGFLELWVDEVHRGRFHAAMISEGTLRLLCLLGIAGTPKPPSVVGYEEPENGVNPARLPDIQKVFEEAASRSGGSQFFLTSHSQELLDLFDGFPEATTIRCEQDERGSRYLPEERLPLFRRVERQASLRDAPVAVGLGRRVARGDLD